MSLLFWQNLKKRTTLELLDKIMVGKHTNGKTMYADLNQVRNLIGAVANGAIVPQIVPSNTLGSPAEAKIYYAPAGTYLTNTNIPIVTTANFNLLIWDLTRWTVMQIPIGFVNERLENLEDKVGDLTIREYFKVMDSYTTRIGGSGIFASKTQLAKNAILKQVRIKMATSLFVEVKAVAIDANVAVVIHNFGIFETITQGDKQVINFEDGFLMPAGSYVSIRNTAGTGFFFDGNQLSGSFEINTLGAVSDSFGIGFDFSVIESSDAESLLFKVFNLERNLQKQGISLQDLKDHVTQNTTDIASHYNELSQLVQAQFTKNTQQDFLLLQHSSKLATFEDEFLGLDSQIANIHNADISQNAQIQDSINLLQQHSLKLATFEDEFLGLDSQIANIHNADISQNAQIQDSINLLQQHSLKLATFEDEFLGLDSQIANIHNADIAQNAQIQDSINLLQQHSLKLATFENEFLEIDSQTITFQNAINGISQSVFELKNVTFDFENRISRVEAFPEILEINIEDVLPYFGVLKKGIVYLHDGDVLTVAVKLGNDIIHEYTQQIIASPPSDPPRPNFVTVNVLKFITDSFVIPVGAEIVVLSAENHPPNPNTKFFLYKELDINSLQYRICRIETLLEL
jgi:hypothetical protein